jgi:hypothetical protein
VTPIAAGDGFSLEKMTIRARSGSWSEPEVPAGDRLVLVRSGVFRARVGGRSPLADPALAYLPDGPRGGTGRADRAPVHSPATRSSRRKLIAG